MTRILLVLFIIDLFLNQCVFATNDWTNATDNQLWSDAGNWTGAVPSSGTEAVINDSDVNGPIVDYVTPNVGTLRGPGYGEAGICTLDIVSGGHLTISGTNNWFIGRYAGSTGIVTIEAGGEVTISQQRVQLGPDGGVGILNMNGGILTMNGRTNNTKFVVNEGSVVHLNDGLILLDDMMSELVINGQIDVNGGMLQCVGDMTGQIEDYEGTEIVAYGGRGALVYDYDMTRVGYTTVIALQNPALAFSPAPVNNARGQILELNLNWSAGVGALSHDVYFGTDYNEVNEAFRYAGDVDGDGEVGQSDILEMLLLWLEYGLDPGNPVDIDGSGIVDFYDFCILVNGWGQFSNPAFKGNFDVSTFNTGDLEPNQDYYWRIDEVNNQLPGSPFKGDVWSFSTLAPEEITVRLVDGRFYDPVKDRRIEGRGVWYWQPRAMMRWFWSEMEERRLDADFKIFKERGFDHITVMVNWGDFVNELWYFDSTDPTHPPESRIVQEAWDRLDRFIDKAAEYDLYVALMPVGQGRYILPYIDDGQTLSTRILQRYQSLVFDDPENNYPHAVWGDPNTTAMRHDFHRLLTKAVQDKRNVLLWVIDGEIVDAEGGNLSQENIDLWVGAIRGVIPNALIGNSIDQEIGHDSFAQVCNLEGMDLILMNSYPKDSVGAEDAGQILLKINEIRKYNTDRPLYMHKGGLSTANPNLITDPNVDVYTEEYQASHIRSVRNICEYPSERFAGYCFWQGQDYDPNKFAMAQDNPNSSEYKAAAFGLWKLDGMPKLSMVNNDPCVLGWAEMDIPNHSFEIAGSGTAIEGWHDGYEGNQPNGWSVSRVADDTIDGSYKLRIQAGTDHPDSIVYCESDLFQCVDNTPLTVYVSMKHDLNSVLGGVAYLLVLEYDESGDLIKTNQKPILGESGAWKEHEINFTTAPMTYFCRVRFELTGQVDAYLDIDCIGNKITHAMPNPSFEIDADGDQEPDGWEEAYVVNGSRVGWGAVRIKDDVNVIHGLHKLRIDTGSGGSEAARVVCESELFPAKACQDYNIETYLYYEAGQGYVDWCVTEYGEDQNCLGISHISADYVGNSDDWEKSNLSFRTNADCHYFKIAFSAGGQIERVRLEVDWLRDYTNSSLADVLIIGDSISIGYTNPTASLLERKANITRIEGNAQSTWVGVANIEAWAGTQPWDVIHSNWGLWDICYRNPASPNPGHRDKINGTLTTSPEDYENNLRQIVNYLKTTHARLIWASTTPVPEDDLGRFAGDEVIYNSIAEQIMNENGILIDDLYSYILPYVGMYQLPDGDVHFTSEGYAFLAEKVAQSILSVLP